MLIFITYGNAEHLLLNLIDIFHQVNRAMPWNVIIVDSCYTSSSKIFFPLIPTVINLDWNSLDSCSSLQHCINGSYSLCGWKRNPVLYMRYYTKVLKTLRLMKIIDQITPAWAMSFFYFFFLHCLGETWSGILLKLKMPQKWRFRKLLYLPGRLKIKVDNYHNNNSIVHGRQKRS